MGKPNVKYEELLLPEMESFRRKWGFGSTTIDLWFNCTEGVKVENVLWILKSSKKCWKPTILPPNSCLYSL